MKSFLSDLKPAVLLTLVFAVILCGVYPLAVWAGGQLLFPHRANGSLVVDASGVVRGSSLLAQNFASPGTFHPRPSAAGTGYDAANSSGTNLGPTSRALANSVQAAVAAYRAENHLSSMTPVPADAVTCSASGLDPDISVENALLQAPRVAAARGLPVATVRRLVRTHVEPPDLGILGDPRVNVLELNLALDRLVRGK